MLQACPHRLARRNIGDGVTSSIRKTTRTTKRKFNISLPLSLVIWMQQAVLCRRMYAIFATNTCLTRARQKITRAPRATKSLTTSRKMAWKKVKLRTRSTTEGRVLLGLLLAQACFSFQKRHFSFRFFANMPPFFDHFSCEMRGGTVDSQGAQLSIAIFDHFRPFLIFFCYLIHFLRLFFNRPKLGF